MQHVVLEQIVLCSQNRYLQNSTICTRCSMWYWSRQSYAHRTGTCRIVQRVLYIEQVSVEQYNVHQIQKGYIQNSTTCTRYRAGTCNIVQRALDIEQVHVEQYNVHQIQSRYMKNSTTCTRYRAGTCNIVQRALDIEQVIVE